MPARRAASGWETSRKVTTFLFFVVGHVVEGVITGIVLAATLLLLELWVLKKGEDCDNYQTRLCRDWLS